MRKLHSRGPNRIGGSEASSMAVGTTSSSKLVFFFFCEQFIPRHFFPRYAAVRARIAVSVLSAPTSALLIGDPVRTLSTNLFAFAIAPLRNVSSFSLPSRHSRP